MNIFDNDKWKMVLQLSRWQSNVDATVEPQLYLKMSVVRKPNADGQYELLPVGSVAQTYLQITKRNENPDILYFNNYVGSHVITEGASS